MADEPWNNTRNATNAEALFVNNLARFSIVVGLLAVVPLVGCAAPQLSEPPTECKWPEPWRGRTPFGGIRPAGLVYATDAAAAQQARTTLASIAERYSYFQSESVVSGMDQGVIVVVDEDDDPLLPDDELAFEVFIRGFAAMSGFPPPSDRQLQETRQRFARLGGPTHSLRGQLLEALPWVITREDAQTHVGIPELGTKHADWIARYPTDARIKSAVKAMVPIVLDYAEQTGDLSAAGRMLVNPFRGLIRSQLAAELIKQRDQSFEQIARQCDPAWIAVRDARRDSMKDWRVLASASAQPAQVQDVLTRADAALVLAPGDIQVLRVLAGAQYRAADYQAALETYDAIKALLEGKRDEARSNGLGHLAQSLLPNLGGAWQRNIENATRLQPIDLAFRGMALAQLGQHDLAAEVIEQMNLRLDRAGAQTVAAKAIYAEARRTVKMLKAVSGR